VFALHAGQLVLAIQMVRRFRGWVTPQSGAGAAILLQMTRSL
jgi:hypothetical protein